MPAERLPMPQIREVLRLKHVGGQSGHNIVAAVGFSRNRVAEYLRRENGSGQCQTPIHSLAAMRYEEQLSLGA